jgi:hypothetical protein
VNAGQADARVERTVERDEENQGGTGHTCGAVLQAIGQRRDSQRQQADDHKLHDMDADPQARMWNNMIEVATRGRFRCGDKMQQAGDCERNRRADQQQLPPYRGA